MIINLFNTTEANDANKAAVLSRIMAEKSQGVGNYQFINHLVGSNIKKDHLKLASHLLRGGENFQLTIHPPRNPTRFIEIMIHEAEELAESEEAIAPLAKNLKRAYEQCNLSYQKDAFKCSLDELIEKWQEFTKSFLKFKLESAV